MKKLLPKLLFALGIGALVAFAIGTVQQFQETEKVVAEFASPAFNTVDAVEMKPGETMVAAGEVQDGVIQEPMVGERVDLPNAEGKPWLTFVYAKGWQSDPETKRLHSMFERDPRLIDLRNRCRVNTLERMSKTDQLTWSKYAGDNTPTIVLQLANGQLVSKISRSNIPANSDQLYAQIKRDCDRCHPKPSPVQPNTPVQPQNPLPDTVLPPSGPDSPDGGDPLWVLAVLGVAGVAGGVGLGRKNKRRGK